MQIVEEGRNNPESVDVAAHGFGVLKSPANMLWELPGKAVGKAMCYAQGCRYSEGLEGCSQDIFPPSLDPVNITGQQQKKQSYRGESLALWVHFTSFLGSFG